ncbi:MAG: 7-carboxy-7-deazaguanine synthase QueE [Chloroflexota bacterium]
MTTYLVNDIYMAVQGEGVQTGVAMVLLRLHGCQVGCPWCDTKETWDVDTHYKCDTLAEILGTNPKYTETTPSDILAYIQANLKGPKWVLVTGGEPAVQSLGLLVKTLQQGGYKVALETSGTELGHIDAGFDWICVSPKMNMPGGKAILPEAIAVADEVKHVVGKQGDIDLLDTLLKSITLKESAQICLQPVSRSQRATILCVETVQQRGWRLSVQTHKYLNLP